MIYFMQKNGQGCNQKIAKETKTQFGNINRDHTPVNAFQIRWTPRYAASEQQYEGILATAYNHSKS